MPDAPLFEFTLSKESLSQMWISGWAGMSTVPAAVVSQKAFRIYLDSLESVQPWDGPTTTPALVVPFSTASLSVPPPVATPSGGSITVSTGIVLTCALSETTIHYSYDGSDPLTSGFYVPNGGTITIPTTGAVTLAIQATSPWMSPSAVVYGSYVNS